MGASVIDPLDLCDLSISTLGKPLLPSTLKRDPETFVNDTDKIAVFSTTQELRRVSDLGMEPPFFEAAGPRKNIFFDPKTITCAIVTCGGLCPGLNDVIRTIVLTLKWQYGVPKVLGFRFGYEGLSSNARCEPMVLSGAEVDNLQHEGGTILGTSRGEQDIGDMVDTLVRHAISMLFVIGGDGTFTGAHEIAKEIKRRTLPISIVGIPKTIDNDIHCSERTFGFHTAVEEARKAILSAHNEAKSAWNGIGLVKLMGRDSGFIAASATLANSDVNFCLIPEFPVILDGEDGLLKRLERRLERKHHAVIVVAEGTGQDLIKDAGSTDRDKSGNIRFKDIGLYLKNLITDHFRKKGIPLTLKYIDPSYMIRSVHANASDSAFCILFGQHAVHAGMAGKTDMFIGYWNNHFTNVPLKAAAGKRKKIDSKSDLWQSILMMTE